MTRQQKRQRRRATHRINRIRHRMSFERICDLLQQHSLCWEEYLEVIDSSEWLTAVAAGDFDRLRAIIAAVRLNNGCSPF